MVSDLYFNVETHKHNATYKLMLIITINNSVIISINVIIIIIIIVIIIIIIIIIINDMAKRGLVYGVRAPVFYRSLREQTGENVFPRIPTGNLFCSYRNLRKSQETSGSLRECVI